MIRNKQFLMLVLLFFGVVGCAAQRSYFEPDKLPDEFIKSALVRTPSPIYRDGKDLIAIKTVDGRPPTFLEDKVIVAPGSHSFQLLVELHRKDTAIKDRGYVTRVVLSLNFVTEAEREYLIDAREDDHGLWVWAVDLETNRIVAGEAPRDLPPDQRIRPIWRDTK